MVLENSHFNYMPDLETERLVLRRLVMKDALDMYEYSKDPLVAEHVLWEAHRSVFDTRSYIRYMQRKYRAEDPASWGIVWKETGKVIGTIGYMWIQWDNASAEVGYSLSRAYWNKGIMTEALYKVLEHGFETLHLNRIEAQHETTNPASGRVMEKCGMRKEGVLRQRLKNKGRYVDVALCAILKKDWTKIQSRRR